MDVGISEYLCNDIINILSKTIKKDKNNKKLQIVYNELSNIIFGKSYIYIYLFIICIILLLILNIIEVSLIIKCLNTQSLVK